MKAIFGFAILNHFNDCTDALQEDVMLYVNIVAGNVFCAFLCASCACVHVCVRVYVRCMCVFVCMGAFVHYVHVCMCVFVCMCRCMCVFVCMILVQN